MKAGSARIHIRKKRKKEGRGKSIQRRKKAKGYITVINANYFPSTDKVPHLFILDHPPSHRLLYFRHMLSHGVDLVHSCATSQSTAVTRGFPQSVVRRSLGPIRHVIGAARSGRHGDGWEVGDILGGVVPPKHTENGVVPLPTLSRRRSALDGCRGRRQGVRGKRVRGSVGQVDGGDVGCLR